MKRDVVRLLRAAALRLDHWDLQSLLTGEPVKLFHGTTASFSTFDISKSRMELVDKFYGHGIFLTPRKRVAWQYAEANRNMGFPPTIIDELKSVNRKAGDFLEALYREGSEAAFERLLSPQALGVEPGSPEQSAAMEHALGNVNGNDLDAVAEWIHGTKNVRERDQHDFVNIFDQSTGMPSWIYDTLDEIGLDSKKYRPKVYTAVVTVSNTLVTADKAQARAAQQHGYDAVVFYGEDLVGDVPEVGVFDGRHVRIVDVEY